MAEDFNEKKDKQFLLNYSEINSLCQQSLASFKRSWLDVPGAFPYYKGKSLLLSETDSVFPIKSIFYSDCVSHSQVVYELMTAMRSWVLTNASNKRKIVFIVNGNEHRIALFANTIPSNLHRKTLEAAFPGIVFDSPCSISPFFENKRRGGVITGIPAFSENETEQLYSLDVLLRGLRGKRFTLITLGVPCSEKEIMHLLDETRRLIGENHEKVNQTISKQTGEGTARTTGVSLTSFAALTRALTASGSLGFLLKIVSIAASIAKTKGKSFGSALGVNYSYTKSQNQSYSNSFERLNQFAEAYEEALKEQEERYENALSEGAWRSITYVLAENDEEFRFVSSLYKSCLTAHFDVYEPFRIVPLANISSDWESTFQFIPEISVLGQRKPLETILTTSEFSSLMSLPAESHPGIEIRKTPRYSVTPECGSDIKLGYICDREVPIDNEFSISKKDISAHALVAGLTGMGKSTTIRNILSQIAVPFLVIEPAKSEYRNMTINGENIRIFTAGDEDVFPLRINPFELPPNESLHSHIDSLAAILNAAFPMEGPMSALVEQGLVRTYSDAGWDVVSGIPPLDNKIPTMDDFYLGLEKTIEKQKFKGDYGCNIKSALLARINSLRIGPRGRLFNSELPFDVKDLLSKPTVIELKKVGSDETKAFLSGLLLLRIYKYFEQKGNTDVLSNVLIIEEAHRLFRRTQNNANSLVGNNTEHQSVSIFENILAEVRAYGLGIIIAEQLPLRLSDGAIKNTNLKIVHRLGALEDAIAMGGSMGLDESRSSFICRMKVGEALIHCSSISEPVHVKISYSKENHPTLLSDDYLKKNLVRARASERRPPYFDSIKFEIESKAPRALEKIADSCLFSIMMTPSSKKEKWGYIWNSCVSTTIPNLAKEKGISISIDMASHLLHSAVLALLKEKNYIASKAPSLLNEMLLVWDVALTQKSSLNIEKIKALRHLFICDELINSVVMPAWLPQEYPSSKRFYFEAKQMAAAIIISDPAIKTTMKRDLKAACSMVAGYIIGRSVREVDIRGDSLNDYTFAVMIALINAIRPTGSTKGEYLANLFDIITKCYQGGNK